MEDSKQSSPYLYTHCMYPDINDSHPLHLATYNGRLSKVQRLTESTTSGIYENTNDKNPTTPLYIAIARSQTNIAHYLLGIVEKDLKVIERYFEHLDIRKQYFWLTESILIALGQEHVDYVLKESIDVRANPDEMDGRTGLLILLKRDNASEAQVVWLTAKRNGDDSRIARIVDRIYYKGGELSLTRRDCGIPGMRDYSIMDVAAKLNLSTLWMRMHSMFAKHYLSKREYVNSFRFLAAHEHKDLQAQRFDELCRTVGGFEPSDIFREPDAIDIFADAINYFKGDITLFDHFMDIAADVRVLDTGCLKETALTKIFNQFKNERSFIHLAFAAEVKTLPWLCLKYKPDMISRSGPDYWLDSPVNRFIEDRVPDQAVEDLIIAQYENIVSVNGFQVKLIQTLVKNNFTSTIQKIYENWPSNRDILFGTSKESALNCLEHCLEKGHFEMVEYILLEHKVGVPERKHLLHYVVGVREFVDLPATLRSDLLEKSLGIDDFFFDILVRSLRNRNLRSFRYLVDVVSPGCRLGHYANYLDGRKTNLLFSSVWDRTLTKYNHYNPDYVYAESSEIVDSDDDESSKALKLEQNNGRCSPLGGLILDENATLEHEYNELFRELIAEGYNWKQLNDDGQNLVHIAVKHNNSKILNILLDLGLNPSVIDINGNSPMHFVTSAAVFEKLPPSDVHRINQLNENPLLYYVREQQYAERDIELLELFIVNGSDVKQSSTDGNTALHFAYHSYPLVKLLIDNGADVNAKNNTYGETPVFCAFDDRSDIEILEILVSHPTFDISLKNNAGRSFLSYIAKMTETVFDILFPYINRDPEKFERLFKEDCNSIGDYGLPVFMRVYDDDIEPMFNQYCLRRFLEMDEIDVHLRADDEHSCFGDERWLLDRGAHKSIRLNKEPLDWTNCGTDYLDRLQVYADAGFNTEMVNAFGDTAMQIITANSRSRQSQRIIARLIAAGANYRLDNYQGNKCLQRTVFRSFYEWDTE